MSCKSSLRHYAFAKVQNYFDNCLFKADFLHIIYLPSVFIAKQEMRE